MIKNVFQELPDTAFADTLRLGRGGGILDTAWIFKDDNFVDDGWLLAGCFGTSA